MKTEYTSSRNLNIEIKQLELDIARLRLVLAKKEKQKEDLERLQVRIGSLGDGRHVHGSLGDNRHKRPITNIHHVNYFLLFYCVYCKHSNDNYFGSTYHTNDKIKAMYVSNVKVLIDCTILVNIMELTESTHSTQSKLKKKYLL